MILKFKEKLLRRNALISLINFAVITILFFSTQEYTDSWNWETIAVIVFIFFVVIGTFLSYFRMKKKPILTLTDDYLAYHFIKENIPVESIDHFELRYGQVKRYALVKMKTPVSCKIYQLRKLCVNWYYGTPYIINLEIYYQDGSDVFQLLDNWKKESVHQENQI